MKRTLIEIVGWYGALAIITAYCLVSFQIVEATSTIFQLLNLTGALSLI
ncbi:MAG: CBU_0592 family membrane protein, partial [Candidatus Binatia bacterium]